MKENGRYMVEEMTVRENRVVKVKAMAWRGNMVEMVVDVASRENEEGQKIKKKLLTNSHTVVKKKKNSCAVLYYN